MKNDEIFKKSILKYFEEIAIDFCFSIDYKPRGDEIWLINSKCIVRFIYDKGYVTCDLVDPVEKAYKESIKRSDGFPSGYPAYPVYSVFKFLYPRDKETYSHPGWDLDEQILSFKKLFVKGLQHILRGDFTWTEAYKIIGASVTEKIQYMRNHWAEDNPVRLKFDAGSQDWEKDFDEYKKYLDGLLRE